jgi:hypothetical protein
MSDDGDRDALSWRLQSHASWRATPRRRISNWPPVRPMKVALIDPATAFGRFDVLVDPLPAKRQFGSASNKLNGAIVRFGAQTDSGRTSRHVRKVPATDLQRLPQHVRSMPFS